MRVIFLDLDGVLVPDGQFPYFKSDLVENLKSVVDATGATIVLSSDWRRQPQSFELARLSLRKYGLDFIDCTPCLSHEVAQRPTEILQWKNDYSKSTSLSLSVRQEQISAWIAIDDRSLLQEQDGHEIQGHFVQTNPKFGLNRSTAHKCIQLLHSQDHAANGLQARISKNESFTSISTADTDGRHSLSTVENFDVKKDGDQDEAEKSNFTKKDDDKDKIEKVEFKKEHDDKGKGEKAELNRDGATEAATEGEEDDCKYVKNCMKSVIKMIWYGIWYQDDGANQGPQHVSAFHGHLSA